MRVLCYDCISEVTEIQVWEGQLKEQEKKDNSHNDKIIIKVCYGGKEDEDPIELCTIYDDEYPHHETKIVARHIREKLLKAGYFDFDQNLHEYLGRAGVPKKVPTPEPQTQS